MGTGRMEIAPFDGKTDYQVWSIKMKALLAHNKVAVALEKDVGLCTKDEKKRKRDIEADAYNLIILSLSDNIIRKVCTLKTPLEMWDKLKTLFENQVTPNLSYLKASLFAFKMDSKKSIDDNLDEFLKMTLMLTGTAHALDDTSTVMILMNFIPDTYQVVKDAFQYTGIVPSFD
ncbi:unnamed protein product [Rhodiola kirilowii]